MGPRVEYRIGVQADAHRIWEIVANLERWGDWNPMYPEAAGKIVIGGTLHLLERTPGQDDRRLVAKVLDWTPYAQLILRIEGGAFAHRLQYIEIDPLETTGCILACGTFFNGYLGKRLARRMGRSLKLGFGLMGEALKAKAEANPG